MKHKAFIAFLLAVCFLLGSCNTNQQPADTTKSTDAITSTTEQIPTETPTELPDETTTEEPEETTSREPDETTTDEPEETTPEDDEDDAYLDIPIQKSKGYTSKEYGFQDSSISLRLKLYLKWEHRENADGGYLFLRDGMEIGRIVSGEADDIADWKIIRQQEAVPGTFRVTEYL